jgi:hypothetical protein
MNLSFTSTQIKPWNIFHLKYKTNHDVSMSFLRIQEYYESPNSNFRGKVFSLEEYMDWYCRKQSDDGAFSYMIDYVGFNVPGNVVHQFFTDYTNSDMMSSRFRKGEHELYAFLVQNGLLERKDFYLIATKQQARTSTITHEIRHGMFYLIPEYREEILKVIRFYKLKSFKKQLRKMGYGSSTMEDEIHAYTLTGLSPIRTSHEIIEMRKKLKRIEQKYLGLSLTK